jgi:NAD(P)-dependent dehydrogenase (short-subunit alcohol dehydrogenase family)
MHANIADELTKPVMTQPTGNQKTFLVTGASTGIGEATAIALAQMGFRVFSGVRNAADAERVGRQSPNIMPIQLDVTRSDEIADAVRAVGQAVGEQGLGGLVNNAGIVVAGPLEVLPIDTLRGQFEVNVFGLMAVTQAFLPLLRKSQGRIVNVSSVNGRAAVPYLGPYCASKHALEALNTAMRTELRAWNIHVALIEPGSTATPIWEKSLAASLALAAECDVAQYELYEADILAMREASRLLEESALGVETVVKAIVHALTSARPRARYPIGVKANLMLRAIKWIPDRLWDQIVQRALRLPSTKAVPVDGDVVGSRQ